MKQTGLYVAAPAALLRRASSDSFVDEVKASLAGTVPDCRCRQTVEATLDRISERRRWHRRGSAIREARESRNTIICLIDLLAEIDDIAEEEQDLSALFEAALLFDDIAQAAAAGAEAARRAGSLNASRNPAKGLHDDRS